LGRDRENEGSQETAVAIQTERSAVDALFAACPVGLGLFDRELRYVQLNEALARINGLPVEAHIGRRADEILPDLDEDVFNAFRSVLETGESIVELEVGGETPAFPGERRHWRTSYFPVTDDAGEVVAAGVVVTEITEERRNEELRRGLELSLHEERAILEKVVGRVPVGICLMWGRELRYRLVNDRFYELLPDRGDVIGRTVDEVFPEIEDKARELMLPVFETGKPIERREAALPFAPSEDEGGGPRYFDSTIVPVPAGDEPVAGLLAVFMETSEAVRQRVQLLRELSAQHEIADVLQRGLLPEQLPQVERIGLAARFLPVGERTQVGGDFYEVFEAHGSLFIILGDVAGKGTEAATTTALVRHMVRALALYERRPAQILERLREALLARHDDPMCTVVCAVINQTRTARRLTIAAAGHPLPLLIGRRGRAREVGAENPLLNLREAGEMVESSVRLRRGDRVFFYTDGLTDAQAPRRILTPDELAGALSGRENLPLGELLDNVVGWAGGPEGRFRDDIAVLALERR
jgi:PAS domain S-box-containing protein